MIVAIRFWRGPLGVVLAGGMLADTKHVGNIGHGAAARQNVGRQGVAETMGVGTKHLCSAEDWRQHSLGNPA